MPEWDNVLSDGRPMMRRQWWGSFFPGPEEEVAIPEAVNDYCPPHPSTRSFFSV